MSEQNEITKKYTFIVGAGADKVYGYPDGGELMTKICNELVPDFRSNPPSFMYKHLCAHFTDSSPVDSFRRKFFYSETYSIDAFLKRNPDYERVGKLAIAYVLVNCERDDALFSKEKGINGEHWFRKLFDTIDQHLDGDWTKLRHEEYSYITFNYSRTLKHYLYCKLKNLHNLTDAMIKDIVSRLNIIQVHGHLGPLPFEEAHARAYEPSIDPETIKQAASSVRIAYETMDKGPNAMIITRIREALRNASKVFVLGFSFHPDNLALLNLKMGSDSITGRIVTSSVGISQSNKNRIVQAIGRITGFEKEQSIMEILDAHAFI
jgi:hypothetical protein